MKHIVRLKDVADSLGISVVTVSNALSGKSGVSEALRNTIKQKADEMGYIYQKGEQTRRSTEKIGILMSNRYVQVGGSFYWTMYQQVAYALSKRGNVGLLEIFDEIENKDNSLPKITYDDNISGIIIIGQMNEVLAENVINKSKVPVILLDFYDEKFNCSAVLSNNYLGTYKATKLLVENGHTGIAFVGNIEVNDNVLDRYFGYRKCLEEYSLTAREDWIVTDRNLEESDFSVSLPNHMPTAFVCSSDWAASILYDKLQEYGYNVPRDISIVGYDNYLYDHSFFEELTTLEVDIKQMAKLAVEMLLKKIKKGDSTNSIRYVDGEIIVRSSVRDIRN